MKHYAEYIILFQHHVPSSVNWEDWACGHLGHPALGNYSFADALRSVFGLPFADGIYRQGHPENQGLFDTPEAEQDFKTDQSQQAMKTAIQQAIEYLKDLNVITPALNKMHLKLLELEEVEERQIKKAYKEGWDDTQIQGMPTAEDYYLKTYKTEI